ncbi:hypothetical protein EJ06DRAFT_491146, partial [Trichodelitschia bisporula]
MPPKAKLKPPSNSPRPKSTLPKNWPPNLPYLTNPLYPRTLPASIITTLHTPPPTATIQTPTLGPSPNTRITPVPPTSSHPAAGQNSLTTTRHLPPSSLILYYLGTVHTTADSDPTSRYDLCLDRELDLGIDAARMGNEARFVNDYRGVAAGPNAEFRDVWVRVAGRVERWVGVYVLPAGKSGKRAAGIVKGEEILVSYGKGFW